MGHYASVCKTKPCNESATGNKSHGGKGKLEGTKNLEGKVGEDIKDDEVLGIFAAKDSGKDGHTLIFKSVTLDQKS